MRKVRGHKMKRKETWKDSERAKKKQKTAITVVADPEGAAAEAEEEVKWDGLTTQQCCQVHDARAKQRHEALISAIETSAKTIKEIVQTFRDRLDKIERSLASVARPMTPPAPVWVQQGTTGVWVGSTASVRPSSDGSVSIRVPFSGLAASSQSHAADVGNANNVQSQSLVPPLTPVRS